MSIPYAAGSLYATVEDLYLWDQALYTNKLLSKKYMDLMYTKHVPAFGGHYGYGWSLDKVANGKTGDSLSIISHGGGINGFNTLISRIPTDKNLIVLFNNTGGAALNEMSVAVRGILYNTPYELPKRSLAFVLYDDINDLGIEKALVRFNKFNVSGDYSLDEGEMNSVGYDFLQADKVKEALAVFKLNIDAFPKSSNVYDSYGEALLKNGEKEKGIENYKRSIELNPANQGGINVLKKLGVDTSDLEKEIVVDEAILESYVGKYELSPGFILTVTKDGFQLKTQASGQAQVDIFPKSDNVFYLKVVEAQLTFNKNENGVVVSVTLHQGGQEMVGKKLME